MKRLYVLILAFLLSMSVHGAVRICAPADGAKGIQAALNGASPYDTIIVKPGSYRQVELHILKPLTFLAEPGVILNGEHTFQVVTIRASHVQISGFEIVNTGYSDMHELSAIRVENAMDVVVSENVIRDAFFGIYLANSKGCRIVRNKIYGKAMTEATSGNGIHLWKCNHLYICYNYVRQHRDGIYFEFTSGSTIGHNTSTKNLRYGLHFMFSNNDGYFYNRFFDNGSGVAVMYSRNVKMQFNQFNDNWGAAAYGLLLKEITTGDIAFNDFKRNTTGIYMEGSSDCRVHYNSFRANGWGLRVQGDCFNDSIKANNFEGNTFDFATNAERNMNVIDNNFWDRYSGYDLDRDQKGDVPYYPVTLFGRLTETYPVMVLFLHSFLIDVLNKAEGALPILTPQAFGDLHPRLIPVRL